MKKHHLSPQSFRQEKLNSFLKQKISSIIKEEDFTEIKGLVTILDVEVTPDFKEAKVWFSSFNQKPEEVLKVLNREIYNIQKLLYKNATMKVMPKIKFCIDHSEEYSDYINKVIGHLKDE